MDDVTLAQVLEGQKNWMRDEGRGETEVLRSVSWEPLCQEGQTNLWKSSKQAYEWFDSVPLVVLASREALGD